MTPPVDPETAPAGAPDDIIYPSVIPFALFHLAGFAAIWTGVRPVDLAIAFGLYWLRMFAITAGYHRYFSHRSFRTGRVFQFILAFLAQSSAQQGALWWAAKHRVHHKYSDTADDVHSPRQSGFWFAHMGWIFSASKGEADYELVRDFTRYPELVWLDRWKYLPPAVLGLVVWLLAGWSGLVVGFVWSTIATYHGTFFINSLAHVHGRQRYVTGDDSRNNWWLALITMGEGWHNNHHYYQSAARQGFRWYEFDMTWYILRGLAAIGLVSDLKEPPAEVVRNERRLPRRTVDRAADELAGSALAEIRQRLREAWAQTPNPTEIAARARQAWQDSHAMEDLANRLRQAWADTPDFAALSERAQQALVDLHLAHLPTLEDLQQRLRSMYAQSPALDEIAQQAYERILAALTPEAPLVWAPGTATV